ncbi:hypothetical protein E2C01_025091 [Portunus trituberculatus]|uniref:Uncharacterized protein n=1 Tax=Portunus trituberculatus TaxID=210409 RepID=A0A5B7EEG9_PORTR|nr:hypothetical protein [Portunus trituberculatus]
MMHLSLRNSSLGKKWEGSGSLTERLINGRDSVVMLLVCLVWPVQQVMLHCTCVATDSGAEPLYHHSTTPAIPQTVTVPTVYNVHLFLQSSKHICFL